MEIKRASNSGFCFGVKRALEKSEEEITRINNIRYKADLSDENSNMEKGRAFTYGPLIHNKSVTDDLQKRGLGIIESIEEAAQGDSVIIRSHGVGPRVYKEAEDRGIHLIDATCPFVKKIQKLVMNAYEMDKSIVIIGDETHPEVIGINGWCNSTAAILGKVEDVDKLCPGSYFVVCQTTLKKELMTDIVAALRDKGCQCEVVNTICSATSERQKSCMELSKEVDAMVIIGGRNSSNTKKLFDIASKNCKNTYFVENIGDLPLKDFVNYNKIGVAAGASTPECVIKEVIASMSENITNENMSMADFMAEIDASLRLPRNGEIVDGTVHQVTDKEVIVNLGCKKDGILPVEEVTLNEGQTLSDLFKDGDEIQTKVIRIDDGEGGILLSKKKLEVSEHWKEISDALENRSTLDVKVLRVVNGGVIAAYKEVHGFIPLSQLSDRYVETADEFLQQTFSVKVIKVDQKKNRVVFSRKAVLSEERQQKLDQIWESIETDQIVEGTVMRFTDYGAFVDIGGIDGLLHISEISWGKLQHPEEVLNIGDKVKVKVLSINKEKGKISLGLKQTTPEPWSIIGERYSVGQDIKGKVVQIKEYGAFIELEPGLDGLVHISEVSDKRVTDIGQELTIGQEVEARILDIDSERKRISLSLKAVAGIENVNEHTEEEEPVEE